jgi:hypothetical protein
MVGLARVSRTVAFAFLPVGQVVSDKVVAFASASAGFFGVLQSEFHVAWAWQYSSTLKLDLSYTPSDCFDTFPFPHPDPRTPLPALDGIGERYHTRRAEIMRARRLGLTKTYNLFHDAACDDLDIVELRRLHVELDTAVRDTYGFTGLDLGHGFHPTKSGTRYTVSEAARRDILDRLLRLNRERAAAEAEAKASGATNPALKPKTKAPKLPKAAPGGAASVGVAVQDDLFGGSAPVQPGLFDLAPADTTQDTEHVRRALTTAGDEGLTRAELTARAGLPEDRARAALDALLARGVATREGQARGTRYRLVARPAS